MDLANHHFKTTFNVLHRKNRFCKIFKCEENSIQWGVLDSYRVFRFHVKLNKNFGISSWHLCYKKQQTCICVMFTTVIFPNVTLNCKKNCIFICLQFFVHFVSTQYLKITFWIEFKLDRVEVSAILE